MCLLYVDGGRGVGCGFTNSSISNCSKFHKHRQMVKFFLLCCRQVMYRQRDMVIGRNKRSVELYCYSTMHVCNLLRENRFFNQKFNLPMGVFSLKFLN